RKLGSWTHRSGATNRLSLFAPPAAPPNRTSYAGHARNSVWGPGIGSHARGVSSVTIRIAFGGQHHDAGADLNRFAIGTADFVSLVSSPPLRMFPLKP